MNFHNAINNLIKSSAFIPVLLGEKPKSIRPLAGGTISSVYKAQMADGRSLVLKFGEDAKELRHEQLFLEAWAKRGIRTPRVLHHTQLPADLSGGLLLMKYVPGENLLPLIDAGKVDEAKVMIGLGGILATMHVQKASGFGRVLISPDGELRGEHKTLDKSLSTREWEEIIEENRQNNNISIDEIHLVDAARDILSAHLSNKDGCLIHDDFRAGNIIYDPDHADPYTVIDPHPAVSHPYLCLAYALLLPEIYGRPDHTDFLQQGYSTVSPLDEDALLAAYFLKALELLPRWGLPEHEAALLLRQLFQQKKAQLRGLV